MHAATPADYSRKRRSWKTWIARLKRNDALRRVASYIFLREAEAPSLGMRNLRRPRQFSNSRKYHHVEVAGGEEITRSLIALFPSVSGERNFIEGKISANPITWLQRSRSTA
jgi:hypothetical protein